MTTQTPIQLIDGQAAIQLRLALMTRLEYIQQYEFGQERAMQQFWHMVDELGIVRSSLL